MTKTQLMKKAIEMKDQGKTRQEMLNLLYCTKFTRSATVWSVLDKVAPNA